MKLKEVGRGVLHRTSIEGVFIREMPLDFVKEIQAAISSEDGNEMLSDELVFRVFDELVRDGEGQKIEDLNSPEDVGGLSMVVIRTIFDELARVMQGEPVAGK